MPALEEVVGPRIAGVARPVVVVVESLVRQPGPGVLPVPEGEGQAVGPFGSAVVALAAPPRRGEPVHTEVGPLLLDHLMPVAAFVALPPLDRPAMTVERPVLDDQGLPGAPEVRKPGRPRRGRP